MSTDDNEPRGPQGREEEDDAASADQPVARDKPPYAPDTDAGKDTTPDKASDTAPAKPAPEASDPAPEESNKSSESTVYDDPYDDDYNYENDVPEAEEQAEAKADTELALAKTPPAPPPGPTTDLDDDEDDGNEDGMARMSFLQHLEELRTRLIRAFIGLLVSFTACLALAPDLFRLFTEPFQRVAADLPYDPVLQLTQITPTEQFMLMYFKIPLLAGIFLGAPWLMYQAWSFIAPGLYKRERRWAWPFIVSTASLFILGGAFCYFVALRFALIFLIGLGYDQDIRPMISLTSYYDMFFNLHVGLGAVFQMPVVIFFFTLLRITSPAFLMRHGRYAILIIFVIAAVITPTPDVTTMLIFAAPMILLYYVGIAVSYLVILKREGKRFPWRAVAIGLLVLALLVALVCAGLYYGAGWRLAPNFPWFQPGGTG